MNQYNLTGICPAEGHDVCEENNAFSGTGAWFMYSLPEREWDRDAKCQDDDPDLFFPDRNGPVPYRFVAAQAKAICYGRDGRPECPVRHACLEEAIEEDELFGIRGGLSHRERNALVRKRDKKRA